MYKNIYIDIVFVTNFLMDYFLLRIVGMLLSCKKNRRRTILAAVQGALFSSVAVLMQGKGTLPGVILCHGVCGCLMLRTALGLKKSGLLAKAMVMLYLSAFLCGGFWEVLSSGAGITIHTFFLLAVCTYFGLSAFLYLGASLRVRRKHIYPVTFSYRGRVQSSYGFYDSGNLLEEPASGKPVSVVCPDLLEKVLPDDMRESLKHMKENPGETEGTSLAALHPRFVPYRTVGKENGVLLAVTLEDLCIHTPGEVVHVEDPVFALSDEPAALEKECKVLLNSRLLQ